MRNRNTGVTLIELVVVMVIIAVLSSIAIPSYRSYVLRSTRADGKAAVLSMAGALERCYTRFNAYDDAGCTIDHTDVPSTDGQYLVTATFPGGPGSFLVTATPQGKQADDTACGSFSMDQTNLKSVGGSKPSAECWGR
ncbi:MAG: type IV pilin protein [Gammaproteobacteria bacterium]